MTTETAPATETTPVETAPVEVAAETATVENTAPVVSADAQVADYSFEEETEGTGSEEVVTEAATEEEAAPAYSVEWPEGYEASEGLTGMVNEVARECGVSDKALGAYTARMIEVLEEQHLEQVKAADAELKAAWGRDYAANMRDVKAFVGKLKAAGNLTSADLKEFAGPRGFKVLHAVANMVGSGGAKGVEPGAVAGDASWAAEVMNDRSHPDNAALRNANDPRHKEVTARWFRAQGARV
ncbi:MAG: hypothetical protein IKW19_00760 [Akkermansia sp.]|nr:hypothetical protein [Akkermansia sp.]